MADTTPKGPITAALDRESKEAAVVAAHPDTTTPGTSTGPGPRVGDPARGVFDTGGTTSVDGPGDPAHPHYGELAVRALQGEHLADLRSEAAEPKGFVSTELDQVSYGGQQVIGNASALAARKTNPPPTTFAAAPPEIEKSLDAAVAKRDKAAEKARADAAKATATA